MRDATKEEQEIIYANIEKIASPTGVNFGDYFKGENNMDAQEIIKEWEAQRKKSLNEYEERAWSVKDESRRKCEENPEFKKAWESRNAKIIKIKYHSDEIEKLRYIDGKSDWIDLRAAEDVTLKAGEFKLISLGVSMELPEGYEAHIVPRSSTYKNFGIIQTNHCAVIDNSYCGDNDIWKYPAYALRDTEIHVNDRICQFRIIKNQPKLYFDEVETLGNADRGGIGSTGKQ